MRDDTRAKLEVFRQYFPRMHWALVTFSKCLAGLLLLIRHPVSLPLALWKAWRCRRGTERVEAAREAERLDRLRNPARYLVLAVIIAPCVAVAAPPFPYTFLSTPGTLSAGGNTDRLGAYSPSNQLDVFNLSNLGDGWLSGGKITFDGSGNLATVGTVTTSNLFFKTTNAFFDGFIESGETSPGASNNCFMDVKIADGFGGWNRTLYVDNDSIQLEGDISFLGSYEIDGASSVNASFFNGGTFTGNGAGLTNIVLCGPTNATPPANTSTIRAWANFTNASGGVFKLPLYQ